MSNQGALRLRLRRLIDDAQRGYSEGAPGGSTNLSALVAPTITLSVNGGAPVTVALNPANLTTGRAIAGEIQAKIMSAEGIPISAKWSIKEGYLLYSPSAGSSSSIRVLPAASGDDVAVPLKLGAANGGYETDADTEFSDEDIDGFILAGISDQNAAGSGTTWTVETLPTEYETLICDRARLQVIHIRLGQTSGHFWQRVGDTEEHREQVFENLLKLAQHLSSEIDKLSEQIDGRVIVSTVSRWDYETATFIPSGGVSSPKAAPTIASVSWLTSTEALVEMRPVDSSDLTFLALGFAVGENVQVIDRTKFSDPNYNESTDPTKGFASPATLYRVFNGGKDVVVRVSGLDNTKDYTFQATSKDMSNTRYFSNRITLKKA